MEFIKLAEVAVVETAADEDKVLIEQNGEIKRVPKTEVGGAGGNLLIFNLEVDMSSGAVTGSANMTLEDAITAINNCELTGVAVYIGMQGMKVFDVAAVGDGTAQMGASCIMIKCPGSNLQFVWTADGFAMMS